MLLIETNDLKMNTKDIIDEVMAARILAGEASGEEQMLHQNKLIADVQYRHEWKEWEAAWKQADDAFLYQSIDAEAAFTSMMGKISKAKTPKKISLSFMQYAAIFTGVALFAAVWLFRSNSEKIITATYEADMLQLKELVLTDGTQLTLNKGSKLVCSQPFTGSERRVRLSGEAWFDVKPNSDMPFIVETDEFEVQVVGTSFNVRDFSNSKTFNVEVESGIVEVVSLGGLNERLRLVAGDGAVYYRDSKVLGKVKANPNFMAWKTGRMEFYDTPLSEIVETLSRVYSREIVVNDSSILDERMGGTFTDNSFEHILSVVCRTFNLNYENDKGIVYLYRN